VIGSYQLIVALLPFLEADFSIYHPLHYVGAPQTEVYGRPDTEPGKRFTLTSSISHEEEPAYSRSSHPPWEKATMYFSQLEMETVQKGR